MTLSAKALAICGSSTFGARPRSIASTRGGVSGISSGRLPVASATAEATVAATLRVGTSPAPFAPSGPRDGAPSWRRPPPARRRAPAELDRSPAPSADTALRVERDLLMQSVAEALDDAALHLARDGARIERPADVLHHGIAEDLDAPGLRIDRQLAIVDGEDRDLERVDEMTARAAGLRGHWRVRDAPHRRAHPKLPAPAARPRRSLRPIP